MHTHISHITRLVRCAARAAAEAAFALPKISNGQAWLFITFQFASKADMDAFNTAVTAGPSFPYLWSARVQARRDMLPHHPRVLMPHTALNVVATTHPVARGLGGWRCKCCAPRVPVACPWPLALAYTPSNPHPRL